MQGLLEREIPVAQQPVGELKWDSVAGNPHQRLLRGYLHKTSNALCGIKGYASLIAQLGQDAEVHARWARKIIHEVERMENLFASVDRLSGMAGGTMTVAAGSDPGLVVRLCLQEAVGRHLNLSVVGTPALKGRLLLPAADLAQVLRDVLDNAAEGGDGQAGPVQVEVTMGVGTSGRVSISITDNAGGIPMHLGSQVRDPFVTGKPGHVGIGLSRVETILDMHGLDWSLESDHGQGTTVTMEVAAGAKAGATLAGKAGDGA